MELVPGLAPLANCYLIQKKKATEPLALAGILYTSTYWSIFDTGEHILLLPGSQEKYHIIGLFSMH